MAGFLAEIDGTLCDRITRAPADPHKAAVFARVRAALAEPDYPCIGARTALKRAAICGDIYPELGHAASVPRLHAALELFADDVRRCRHSFLTFVAVFEAPGRLDEALFETLLWRHLQALHDHDAPTHGWDTAVDSDPASPRFGYSIAGTAWFVVGLHPGASRRARRFERPVLVFNAHSQFATLRAQGRYDPMRDAIRTRDIKFSGSINPNLADFGSQSDARQYAGGAVGPDWLCPLAVRKPLPAGAGPVTSPLSDPSEIPEVICRRM